MESVKERPGMGGEPGESLLSSGKDYRLTQTNALFFYESQVHLFESFMISMARISAYPEKEIIVGYLFLKKY